MSNGRHLILDLYDCDQEILDNYDQLSELLETALQMANATILRIIGEKFKPQGVTLLALLSESHASIHTWPEIGYAAIDLYTCGAVQHPAGEAQFSGKVIHKGAEPHPLHDARDVDAPGGKGLPISHTAGHFNTDLARCPALPSARACARKDGHSPKGR